MRARGGRGFSVSERSDAQAEVLFAAYLARTKAREVQRLARHRVTCGAKTRKGWECRYKSEPGKRRCKFHGGKSTGAKTPEGIARTSEARRRRWARLKLVALPLACEQLDTIGVCQTSCPPISCGISDFGGADIAFRVQPDGSGRLPVAGFS